MRDCESLQSPKIEGGQLVFLTKDNSRKAANTENNKAWDRRLKDRRFQILPSDLGRIVTFDEGGDQLIIFI